ncbi:MAG: ribosome silencing factor [Nitrospirae bacterium RBG_19FT_COMBO_42_15]|nr:MAG: ribosome silencing factor [Nitrospirae bacterium RBG_19FT_COMBO_42_15]
MDSKKKAMLCAKAASDKKAEDIIILDVRKISSIADYFIICTAASTRQIKAVYENIDKAVSAAGESPYHIEGTDSSQWVLVDCFDVVIHIFNEESRNYYSLERLWGDAPRVTGRLK